MEEVIDMEILISITNFEIMCAELQKMIKGD